MRRFIKEPVPELFAAIQALEAAADAHMAGDYYFAASKFKEANCPVAWEWLNAAWINPHLNVVLPKPNNDSRQIPKSERDQDRNIKAVVKKAVLERDGYRCWYCELPVIHADIRKIAHNLYPSEVPWNSRVSAKQHSGFQVSWLQFDHVVPHSHGGASTLDNVVISCALCNFGKFNFTLKQLDIEDPRLFTPVHSVFDGLERLRGQVSLQKKPTPRGIEKQLGKEALLASHSIPTSESFFFAGATISAGYVNVPAIAGKTR